MTPRFCSSLAALVFLTFTTLLLPVGASADWRPVGPDGGHVTLLAVTSGSSSAVLAGTRADGVFRSADRAATWQPVQGDDEDPAWLIVPDPRRPGTVYSAVGL